MQQSFVRSLSNKRRLHQCTLSSKHRCRASSSHTLESCQKSQRRLCRKTTTCIHEKHAESTSVSLWALRKLRASTDQSQALTETIRISKMIILAAFPALRVNYESVEGPFTTTISSPTHPMRATVAIFLIRQHERHRRERSVWESER
jgi:hypothetical protein